VELDKVVEPVASAGEVFGEVLSYESLSCTRQTIEERLTLAVDGPACDRTLCASMALHAGFWRLSALGSWELG
jgi:hypothetical protein